MSIGAGNQNFKKLKQVLHKGKKKTSISSIASSSNQVNSVLFLATIYLHFSIYEDRLRFFWTLVTKSKVGTYNHTRNMPIFAIKLILKLLPAS